LGLTKQTAEELREKSEQLRMLADKQTQIETERDELLEMKSWLTLQDLGGDYDVATNMSKHFEIPLNKALDVVEKYPREYLIDGEDVPSVVKSLRMWRRDLKGDFRKRASTTIDTLINAYSSHIDNCIKSIYWVGPYERPLRMLVTKESDIRKLHSLKDYESRSKAIDLLAKYWEGELDKQDLPYNKEYARLSKELKTTKKEFKDFIKSIQNNITTQDKLDNHILKSVCDMDGISGRQIFDTLPTKLKKYTSNKMISKSAHRLGITIIDEEYFKLPDMIKKDVYSYTAAFIDSDGYITIDKNCNPRIGLVATGNRGKAFMIELHKELGFGRLHLDQKSPQDTRPVNRLHFYSQGDIHKLLTNCRDHFRMKGPQADRVLELVRIKKYHKKQEWAKNRLTELFKLVKWHNHQDNKNYDFTKYEIDIENISKLEGNCKNSIMDALESIAKSVDDAIDDLEEIVEEYDLDEHDWSSVDDASDYLFEHKGPQGDEEE